MREKIILISMLTVVFSFVTVPLFLILGVGIKAGVLVALGIAIAGEIEDYYG